MHTHQFMKVCMKRQYTSVVTVSLVSWQKAQHRIQGALAQVREIAFVLFPIAIFNTALLKINGNLHNITKSVMSQ